MKAQLILACALAASAATGGLALASSTPDGGSGFPIRPITWDQFKDSCRHPGEHQAQRPPANIKIICRDDRFSWQLSQKSEVTELPQGRNVGSELFSDKFHVGASNQSVCVDGFAASCPVYDQVELTFNLEQSVSCNDVQDFKGTLTDYCEDILNDAYAKNSSAYAPHPTGKSVNFCGHDGHDGYDNGGNDNASPIPAQKGSVNALFDPAQ